MMSLSTVSVNAETVDMAETNGILRELKSGIESKIDNLQTYITTILSEIDFKISEVLQSLTNYEYPVLSSIFDIQDIQVSQNEILQIISEDVQLSIESQNTINVEQIKQTALIEEIKEVSVSSNKALYRMVEASEADINNAELMQGLNESIADLNENLDMINTFFAYTYAFLIFILVVIIAVVVYRLINKTLIHNMFRG